MRAQADRERIVPKREYSNKQNQGKGSVLSSECWVLRVEY